MKKILFLLLLFVGFFASAQVHKIQVVGLDTLTTAERDLISVPLDRVYLIWNETTGQFEYSNKGAAWQALITGGGVTDHGALTGLADDDHPQYALDTDLSAYLPLSGGTMTGNINMGLGNIVDATNIEIGSASVGDPNYRLTTINGQYVVEKLNGANPGSRFFLDGSGADGFGWTRPSGTGAQGFFDFGNLTAFHNYFLPNKSGTIALLDDLAGAGTDDQTAAEVPITDTGGFYAAADLEGALQELGNGVTLADITVVGDGVTDNTAEINSNLSTYGIAYLVGNCVSTSLIDLTDGMQLMGPGNLTNNTTDVLRLNGRNIHIDLKVISSNAGHIITFTGDTFHATIKNTRLSALNTTKSQIYHRLAVGVFQLTVEDCEFETGPNHTVPMIDVIASAENFNDNKFVNNLFQTNGNPSAPVIRLETTATNLWMSGNIIDGALFEVPTAGAIHAFSQIGLKLNNVHVYDLPTTGPATDDMILIDNGSGPGLNSAGVQISGYHRIAGDLTTNSVYDINVLGAFVGSVSIYDAVGLASSQLLFNGLTSHTVYGGYYISNYGGATINDQVDASGFNGNLATTDNTLQEIAQKFDDFTASGTGDVVGPASSVNNELAIFDGTTGKLIKNDSRFYIDGTTGELVVADAAGSVKLDRNAFALDGTDGDEDFFFANRTLGDIFLRTTNASSVVQTRLTIPGGTNDPVITADADINIIGANDLQIGGTALSSTGGAALVGYNNATSGLTATEVQAAIDELDAAIASGLSAENQSRIDNLNKYRELTVSTNSQTSLSANAYTTDSPFEGKVRTVVNGNFDYFLSNNEPLNTPFVIQAGESATDSVVVKRDETAIQLQINGKQKALFADGFDGFSLYQLESAVVERTANNQYKVVCDCNLVTSCAYGANEFYQEDDALTAETCKETATVSGAWVPTGATITAVADTPQNGTHVYNVEAFNGLNNRIDYTFAATAGDTFDVTYWIRQTTGTDGIVKSWANVTGGPTYNITSSWVQRTESITVSSTGNVILRFYASEGLGSAGDDIQIDGLSILKTN